MKRKICVFTGTRAEYGLLAPLMKKIRDDRELCLQTIVSGAHLSREHGFTYKEIIKEGFKIDKKIAIDLNSDTETGVARSFGLGVEHFAKALTQLRPHIVVILGDRYEAFAMATAAMICRVPIAHLYGGEVTIGAIDEAIRHSITKMSHFHFVATKEYRQRVIQLGENSKSVLNVGALGVDNIKELNLLSKKELEQRLGFSFDKRNLLITYHPVTLEKGSEKKSMWILLSVLNGLKNTRLIFTKANADMGGCVINSLIEDYVRKNRHKAVCFTSLGQLNYLSAMKYVDAVVGNSSSGIIEASSFKIGTIDIGNRQAGRIKADSVISCGLQKASLEKAFRKLYSKRFQEVLLRVVNPYGNGRVASRIVDKLKSIDLDGILKKKFYDLKCTGKRR
ncbi:MAG: UDP-N-acetylglucosamine 2-epimerase [Candidatus Omnitrophica bacterium]|nr:UDP-N-acetylglucosamine 2-epimerase [Candidatus Omnitrophota bacterium]